MSLQNQRAQYFPGIQRIGNFAPVGNGIALNLTTSNEAVQFPALLAGNTATDCMVINPGTVAAFITFGNASPTAATPVDGTPANGICIPGGVVMVFDKGASTWVAGITATSTTTLYLYQGVGS